MLRSQHRPGKERLDALFISGQTSNVTRVWLASIVYLTVSDLDLRWKVLPLAMFGSGSALNILSSPEDSVSMMISVTICGALALRGRDPLAAFELCRMLSVHRILTPRRLPLQRG